jgi:hypothetical protein
MAREQVRHKVDDPLAQREEQLRARGTLPPQNSRGARAEASVRA